MAVVASLKTRMLMETDEYMAAADKVIRRTSSMSQQIGSITNKIGKSYMGAITGGVMSMVGANAVDAAVRSLADGIANLDVSRLRDARDVFESIGTHIENAVRQIPLVGAFYELGQAMARTQEDVENDRRRVQVYKEIAAAAADVAQREREIEAAQKARAAAMQAFSESYGKRITDLNLELQLLKASSDVERERLRRMAEMAEIMERIAKEMKAAGYNEKEIKLAQDNIKKKLEERNRLLDEQRKKQEQQRALEEAQREQEALAREREIADEARLAELKAIQSASNVVGIGTAVGSVRVAGAVDYSSDGMAKSLENIRDIDARIEENTRKLKDLQRAA